MLATTAIPDKEEKYHPSNDLARDPTGQTGMGTLIVMRITLKRTIGKSQAVPGALQGAAQLTIDDGDTLIE